MLKRDVAPLSIRKFTSTNEQNQAIECSLRLYVIPFEMNLGRAIYMRLFPLFEGQTPSIGLLKHYLTIF